MSIYQKATIIASYPAYDVVELLPSSNGIINMKDGDSLIVGDKPTGDRVISSVMSYALENGECPIEAYNHAVAKGHNVYFVMHTGASISRAKQERGTKIRVEFGQLINFQGHIFELVPLAHDNIGLKMIK